MKHVYLRAYMAGITLPTMVLLIILAVVSLLHYGFGHPLSIERFLIFPMAVVPNLWGAWNMIYTSIHQKRTIPIGAFGAALPFVLVPLGVLTARLVALEISESVIRGFPVGFVVAVALYYLAWKFVVQTFNRILGIG